MELCWNIALVAEMLCSLILLPRHLLDSAIKEELQFSSVQVH